MAKQVKRDAANATEAVKERVDAAAEQAQKQAENLAKTGISRAASEVGTLAEAVKSAANTLFENDQDSLGGYARQVGHSLASVADDLQNKTVDEIAHSARNIARSNPTAFLLGSVAAGFALSRFFKASARRSDQRHEPEARNHPGPGTAPGQFSSGTSPSASTSQAHASPTQGAGTHPATRNTSMQPASTPSRTK